jgi:hypothetical protein
MGYTKADYPMDRVPKMETERFPRHVAFAAGPNYYFFCPTSFSIA